MSIARYLAAVGEATELPRRSPSRGPPYWKSRVLRRQAFGHEDGCHRGGGDEAPQGRGESAGRAAAGSSLSVPRNRRHGALPRSGAATCRGAIGVAERRGRPVRQVRYGVPVLEA